VHINVAQLSQTLFTQYNVKQGLKKYGKRAEEAVLKELKQIHDREVMEPKEPENMTFEEKRNALNYLIFVKEKRCGTIKGRGCADGRKQRLWTTKSKTSSPTVSTESLFLSCVIDAKEERDVATCDIPGAFMQADMEGTVHMQLEGEMAELIVKLDPKLYRKYVRYERGKPVIYVRLKKALYGTLEAHYCSGRNCPRALKSGVLRRIPMTHVWLTR
jgi:hypothetical protein